MPWQLSGRSSRRYACGWTAGAAGLVYAQTPPVALAAIALCWCSALFLSSCLPARLLSHLPLSHGPCPISLQQALALHHLDHQCTRRFSDAGELLHSSDSGSLTAAIRERGEIISLPWHVLQVGRVVLRPFYLKDGKGMAGKQAHLFPAD